MKAVVFAAGMGTRLKPFTDRHPKALVDIDGEAMLGHVLLKIKAAGISEVIVNVHHFASQIVDYLKARNDFGMTVHISDESALLLDTGGALALLYRRGLLENCDSVLVHNADIMTDIDLHRMYEDHLSSGADASLLVADRKTSRYLLFDTADRLCGWINRSTGETRPDGFLYDPAIHKPMAFGGIHIISPSIFPTLAAYSSDKAFSIIPYYLSECRHLKFTGYTPGFRYRWCDIGKLETLRQAEQVFANG